MAKVLVCDRCGKKLEYIKKCSIVATAYRYRLSKETFDEVKDYDLCPTCRKAFEEFMKGPTEGDTEGKIAP